MVTLATRSLFINGDAARGDKRGPESPQGKAGGAATTSGDSGATVPRHPKAPMPHLWDPHFTLQSHERSWSCTLSAGKAKLGDG